MNRLTHADIWDLERYEKEREMVRTELRAEKGRRRLAVGDNMTLLFETWKTLWYQVQEMCRAENITSEAGVAHELETYNELMPRQAELSATMMIEYTDPDTRDERLRALVGLENHVWLVLEDKRIRATFDDRQMNDERLSSVQFIKFDLDGMSWTQWSTLAEAGHIAVEIDHPEMAVRADIRGHIAAALAFDLQTSEQQADKEDTSELDLA